MTFMKLIGVFGLFTSVAVCQVPAVLTVQGIGGKAVTFFVSDLSKLPQQTVKATDHGTPAWAVPSITLFDLQGRHLSNPCGPELVRNIKRVCPCIAVVLMSAHIASEGLPEYAVVIGKPREPTRAFTERTGTVEGVIAGG